MTYGSTSAADSNKISTYVQSQNMQKASPEVCE